MSRSKRLQKIETSLTPPQAALLWLKGMMDVGHERYMEKMSADAINPRVVTVKTVAEAVRQNVNEALITKEVREQAVREAQKQTDMLVVLILELHEYVRSECTLNYPYRELLDERFSRILGQYAYAPEFCPKSWDLWQALLTTRLIKMRGVRGIVQSISASHYDGQPLLFTADENALTLEIGCLEDLMKEYNSLKGHINDWKAIDLQDLSSVIAQHVEMHVQDLIVRAKVRTFIAFGEEQAARELLESSRHSDLREIKRLRSLNSKQDTFN